jgi:DNA-directed RNA polymerase subunit K/omega
MGIEDVLPTDNKIIEKVNKALEDSFIKADAYASNIINDHIREAKQIESMQEAQKKAMNIVEMQRLSTQLNNLEMTVISGAKGTNTNRLQTQIAVGQQHLSVGRIPLMLDGSRTLPHYPKDKLQMTLKEVYESRGFISNSLTVGLNAQEFFFYAMSGRENICDTAMGTPLSGYIQRRLVKIMEDFEIMYDNTVRDVSTGDIIQLSYGDDDVSCNKILQVGGSSQMMNISAINDMLSTEFDLLNKENKINTITEKDNNDLFNSIISLSPVTEQMIKSDLKSIPVLTKYEYSKIIQTRAEQISRNDKLITIDIPTGMIRPDDIARLEFKKGKIPYEIIRKMPDGSIEKISYKNLIQ